MSVPAIYTGLTFRVIVFIDALPLEATVRLLHENELLNVILFIAAEVNCMS